MKCVSIPLKLHRSVKQCLGIFTAGLVLMSTVSVSSARSESPSRFMQRVANELISATQSGSSAAIGKVITNYAYVYGIGEKALGSYSRRLKSGDRSNYHRGLTRFVSRYAASESPKYPVIKAIVTGASRGGPKIHYVDSNVVMRGGQSYSVRWVLVKIGSRYKVYDAEVLGFRAGDQLSRLFQNFLSKNGGNPRALVAKLLE